MKIMYLSPKLFGPEIDASGVKRVLQSGAKKMLDGSVIFYEFFFTGDVMFVCGMKINNEYSERFDPKEESSLRTYLPELPKELHNMNKNQIIAAMYDIGDPATPVTPLSPCQFSKNMGEPQLDTTQPEFSEERHVSGGTSPVSTVLGKISPGNPATLPPSTSVSPALVPENPPFFCLPKEANLMGEGRSDDLDLVHA